MTHAMTVLAQADVRDPITQPGWYVLGRRGSGRWEVIASRVQYEHIMAAWFNRPSGYPHLALACVDRPGLATVYRHATV